MRKIDMYEKSLIIFKPDAVIRRMTGQIITRFENVGLKLHAMRFEQIDAAKSKIHYAEHVDKGFYPTLEEYITSGPVLTMVLGGFEAIAKIRAMVGATNPAQAAPGTIRGDFAHQGMEKAGDKPNPLRNLIHASACLEDAQREIEIWFGADEIVEYNLPDDYIHGV